MTESLESIRESSLIALTTPLYLIVIGVEVIFSNIQNRNLYSVKGTFTNFYLMLANMGLDLLVRGVSLFALTYCYSIAVIHFENVIVYWVVLLIAQDFMYYLLHVVDHYCRLFWAIHVTHHSSEEFNLTVGFRSSVLQPLYRFLYFIPLALAGFRGVDILFMYSATQIYGILVHTQTINKLGFLEWFMVTPSHHRVHHASNPLYLDRNMGMVFIIWDRMFGTFQEELPNEPATFGLTKSLENPTPLNTVFHEFQAIFRDVRKPGIPLKARLNYVLGPPGWSHDGSSLTARELRERVVSKK
ncbi:MAG TPA: sterol desaturase family protein [Bacteroidia bacterium]|nr:sterol desaturase family protein [Bacteroidia bacterium]